MDEFLEKVARPGLLQRPMPGGLHLPGHQGQLWAYLESAAWRRPWSFEKYFMGFNLLTPTGGSAANPSSGKAVLDRSAEVVFGGFKRDRADSRYREMLDQGRRELVPYNRSMSEQRVVHLVGKNTPDRLLTHFYTYLYWEDYHTEQIYKR